jgi:hypothetical protein
MFDGLDDVDDEVPIDVGTAATAADPAAAPELPEWITNKFDTNGAVEDLGITFVDGGPVVPDQNNEPDTPHVVEDTPEEEEEDVNDDSNVYARELPVSSMDGFPFRQPAQDMMFREMSENLQMRCSDMRAPVVPAFVEWKSLIKRTVHAGLLAQMDQLEEIIEPINEKHTLIAYGRMFILTNGARASMDPCDWYTFKFIKRGMRYSVFPRSLDECLFNLWIDN